MTEAEKITELDRLCEELRQWRGTESPWAKTYEVVAELAKERRSMIGDLRIRSLEALEQQIDHARRHKGRFGFVEIGNAQAIGEYVLQNWKSIRSLILINTKGEAA